MLYYSSPQYTKANQANEKCGVHHSFLIFWTFYQEKVHIKDYNFNAVSFCLANQAYK